jgi:hypothetical protein
MTFSCIWLRTATSGGLVCEREWAFWLYKMRKISWLYEDKLTSQKDSSMSYRKKESDIKINKKVEAQGLKQRCNDSRQIQMVDFLNTVVKVFVL